MRTLFSAVAVCLLLGTFAPAQRLRRDSGAVTVLRPARAFDGDAMQEGWAVSERGERIEAVVPAAGIDTTDAKVIDLPDLTLMPGMVVDHSHILLRPYNETP